MKKKLTSVIQTDDEGYVSSHWFFDGKEIAIIREEISEIEWIVSKKDLPTDIIKQIREI